MCDSLWLDKEETCFTSLLFLVPIYSLGKIYLTRPPLLLPSIEYFHSSVHHLWSGQLYFPDTVYGG